MNYVRVATCVFLLACCLFSNRAFRTSLNPIVVATLPWLLVLLGQQAFVPNFPFGVKAAFLVILGTVTFGLGSIISTAIGQRRMLQLPDCKVVLIRPHWLRYRWRILVLCQYAVVIIQVVIAAYYINVLQVGRYEDGGMNPYAVYDAIGEATIPGYVFRFSVLTTYGFAGLITFDVVRQNRMTLTAGLFLLIVSIQTVLTSTRSTMLLALSVMVTVLLSTASVTLRRVSLKAMFVAATAVLVAIALFAAASERRYGRGFTLGDSAGEHQAVAMFGAVMVAVPPPAAGPVIVRFVAGSIDATLVACVTGSV